MEDKAKGRMKEAAGAVTGDEEKKAEGAGPSRGRAKLARRPRRRREPGRRTRQAEKERDKQRGKGC
jgi:hypothetical protein